MKIIFNRFKVKMSIVILFLVNSVYVMAQVNPYTQITTNPSHDINPDIYERKVVYETYRNGSWDIYMYDIDLATEVPVCTSAADQRNPAIWADKIVWQDFRNGEWDIYMYHLTYQTEYCICDSAGDQMNPDIWREYIVYQDNRSGDFDIYMYNWGTFTETPICVRSGIPNFDAEQTLPSVSNYKVVWQDFRNWNNDIYIYDFYHNFEQQITTDLNHQTNPMIKENRILYNDQRNGNSDVYMYYIDYWLPYSYDDLELPLSWLYFDEWGHNSFDQKNGFVSGGSYSFINDELVLQDDRSGSEDIYLFTFAHKIGGNKIQVTNFPDDEEYPVVWGDIVVWEDNRAGISNRDLWMWERPPGADLSVSLADNPDPVQKNSYITYTVNITNYGPLTATDVLMTDTLPAYTSFFSVTTTKGSAINAGNIVTCSIDSLMSGEQAIVTIVAKALVGGQNLNKASVSQTEVDYIEENNIAYELTSVKSFSGYSLDNGINPSIATDQNGRAHICYVADYDNLVYQTNAAGDWTYKMIDSSGYMIDGAITIDNNDIVHIAYIYYDWMTAHLLYTNNSGGIWQPADTITSWNSNFGSIDIACDTLNFIHLVYLSNMWTTGSAYYLNNTTGSWSGSEIFNEAYNSISLSLDSNDNAHVAFYSLAMNRGACYMTNAPSGIWHPLEEIETDWIGGQMEGLVIDIDVDDSNTPHIIYVGSDNYDYLENHKYATKAGGNWQTTVIEHDDNQSAGNSICINTDNSVHLCYYHKLSNRFHYATNDSGLWRLENLEDNGWMNDIAADINGNIHVTFEGPSGINYMLKSREVDSDSDGIPDEEEYGPDGIDPLYDGNGDGMPDCQQDEVASFQTYNDSLYVTLATELPAVLSNTQAIENPAPNDSGAPDPASVPYGFFSFTILGLDHGDSTVAKLILHGSSGLSTYYKYGPTPDSIVHWFEFDYDGQTGAIINTDTVKLYLTDGLRGDYDVTVNGIIKEPGGPILTITGIGDRKNEIPGQFKLHQNYPNPFNPVTHIKYELPKSAKVSIEVYNILGQKVLTLVNVNKKAGLHETYFNGNNLASGLYFYKIEAGEFKKVRKMLLIK